MNIANVIISIFRLLYRLPKILGYIEDYKEKQREEKDKDAA